MGWTRTAKSLMFLFAQYCSNSYILPMKPTPSFWTVRRHQRHTQEKEFEGILLIVKIHSVVHEVASGVIHMHAMALQEWMWKHHMRIDGL
jgi:hypothetical protein